MFFLRSLRVSFLYTKHFSVRFLDLVALPSRPCGMITSFALCSTHCEHELSPGTLDVFLILVQFPWCWFLLTITDWHLVIPFGFFLYISGLQNLYPNQVKFSKWHSSHKVNQILQLYILLACYCTIWIWVNMLYLTDNLMNLSISINNL